MPRTFDEVIGDVKRLKGWTRDEDVGNALKLSRSAYSERKRRGALPLAELIRFCEEENISVDDLLFGPRSFSLCNFALVPMLHEPEHARPGQFAVCYRKEECRRKGDLSGVGALQMESDCMEPTLHEGDLVIVDTAKTEAHIAGIYAVSVKGKRPFIFRLQPVHDGQVHLTSDNSKYKPVTVKSEDIKIVGKVIFTLRQLS